MKGRSIKLPRPVLRVVLTISTLFLVLARPFLTFLYHSSPTIPGESREVLIDIPRGASLRQTANLLLEGGLISNADWFVAAGKILWIEHRIKPGEYLFHSEDLPVELIARLRAGDVLQVPVTIPEGFSIRQISEHLEQKGLAPGAEFIARAMDPGFVQTLGLPGPTLEGYVYPDSYFFTKQTGIDTILRTMVGRFHEVFTDEMKARGLEIGMTVHEVVTLASIIEKETGAAEERKRISSVFHNRLRKRIRLQSDPTVIYAIPNFDGNLTRKHLKFPSPYNTYYARGLPPGPIASPGKEALLAVLYPEKSAFLYFVSRNDGTHQFSRTLSEHNRAVDQYQRRRGRRGQQ